MRCIVILLLVVVGVVHAQAINTTVLTSSGWVQGFTYPTHMVWLGIPYAQPPIGPLRWQSPQPKQAWTGILPTTSFGHTCIQSSGANLNEDCLYINVWTPLNPATKGPLPVYLWVHGGGFVAGNGDIDGRYISGNDSIFVSINYRLGTLGFYATQQLLSKYGTTGFYGIQDQRFAMAWVQKNIAAFGGDPTKVTIGGESAGGNSMCIHLSTPRSAGLFRAIIMESGLCGVWQFDTGMNTSTQVTKNAGCSGASDELACMLALNGTTVYSAYKPPVGFVYYPTLHSYEITEYPLVLVQQGNYNKVPILTGTNADEGSAWTCGMGNITVAQYTSELNALFGAALTPLVLQQYPPASYPAPISALIDVTSDIWFKCVTDYVIIAMTTTNPDIKNYLYSFEHVPSYVKSSCLGATHASELGFIFGAGLTGQEAELSQIMRDLWSTFIVTGVPSISPSTMDPVPWPVFAIHRFRLTNACGYSVPPTSMQVLGRTPSRSRYPTINPKLRSGVHYFTTVSKVKR